MISTIKIQHVIVAALALVFAATSPTTFAQMAEATAAEEIATAPANDAAFEVETWMRLDEFRNRLQSEIQQSNEFQRQYLDDRLESIDRWAETVTLWLTIALIVLGFFALALPIVGLIAGYLGFTEFKKIEAEAREAVDKAGKHVKKIAEYRKQAKEDGLKIKYAQTDNETMSGAPSFHKPDIQDEGIFEEIRRAPNAQSINKNIDDALALQDAGEVDKAIEAWRAIAIRAENIDNKIAARAWFSAGRIMRELEEQMTAYNRAIRFDSEFDAAYNSRGIARGWVKRYKEAIEDFDKAIHLNSKNAYAYSNRGNAKRFLKKYESAIKDLNEAIHLDPNHVAYIIRGNVKSDIEQYCDAIKDYDAAIRLDPNNVGAYHYRGNAKINIKQHDEAIKDYDEAIRLDPKSAFTYTNRGAAKAELKRYESAIEDFDQAIYLYPKDFYAYFNRGNAKAELKLDGARSDLQTALKLAKKSGDEFMATEIIEAIQELDDTEQNTQD